MVPFHRNLRAWRIFTGLTQEALCRKSGLPRPNLVALEQGRRECTLTTLRRISHALGVSSGTLLDRSPPGVSQDPGRHEIDRLARSLVGDPVKLAPSLHRFRNQALREAGPLLRAAGLTGLKAISHRRKRADPVVDREIVSRILRRISKLAPAYVRGEAA